jgi:GxxExxY protein
MRFIYKIKIMKELKNRELTEKIIGCAMRVHAALGNGFQEVIYQRALEMEMYDNGIKFGREISIPVHYKHHQIGERRVDFLVENIICVELKAIVNLEKVHLAQAKNYLEAFNLEVGLLLNFGSVSLEFRRIENLKVLK